MKWIKLFDTLRIRLVLWSLVVNALLLIAIGGGVWLSLRQIQNQQINDTLQLSAAQLAATLDVNQGQLAVPSDDATTLLNRGVFVWVLNGTGHVDSTIGQAATLKLPTITSDFQEIVVQGHPVRLFHYILKENAGTIVLGISLEASQQTLQTVLIILAAVIPLALIASAAGSIFLASRALKPIATITAQAQRISHENLSERLAFSASDEIGQLAQTFDQMLDRLQTAFEQEQQFIGNVSHELRTPLSMLKAQISLALSRPRDVGTLVQMLHAMDSDADRMARLIDRMLTLIQIESEESYAIAVNLCDLFSGLLTQLQPLADIRQIVIQLDAPPKSFVSGDPDQLTQLFLNLLDNALKYSYPNSEVRVRIAAYGSDWQIDVIDTGIGIAPEHVPHLHQRFYRVDASRTRQTGGIGLGLAIAYAIAQQHDGRIDVNSAPGQGTTFFSVFARDNRLKTHRFFPVIIAHDQRL